jgi:Transglycosylase-like domain
MVISGLLLLTFFLAAAVPAQSTSVAEEHTNTASVEAAKAECPEGKAESKVEPTAEAEAECESQEEEPAESGSEEGQTPSEEGEEDQAEQPVIGTPSPESGETVTPSPEAASEGHQKEPSAGEGTHSGSVVPGSSLKGPSTHKGGSAHSSPHDAGSHHGGGTHHASGSGKPHSRHHSGGANETTGRSGGTTPTNAAGDSTFPAERNWSGPWAIPWQIVACESGGNYRALNASSGAGGAYQILPSTWSAYGGKGLPQLAPPAEQDRIAAEIWADSGPSAWVCAQGGAWLGAGLSGALGSLPDPLPPARRLDPAFMSSLLGIARAQHVDWAVLLATVRLRGGRGHVPATDVQLRRIAGEVAAFGRTPLRAEARDLFARRADQQRLLALTYYDRAVGRKGLVKGLEAIKHGLEKRVLASRRLLIYTGGRGDVQAGRVDVRVLTLLLYLAQRYHSVTVSCLVTGHSFLTTAGRPSLHPFGRAVDIAALNGTPILGHQQPGGLTEHALRRILLLPRELQPSELISLFNLGGPSFALPDHADHIHVGF